MMLPNNGDPAARGARWMEYIQAVFSEDPPEREREYEERNPVRRERERPERVTWQVGMLAFIPLSADEDSLPMGHYFVMSDPEQPVVSLALARRDPDGYTAPSEHTILVSRERLAQFKAISWFPGY